MNLKNGKSNKAIGNDFENEFSDILFKHGFWNHILAQNQRGQPFDVIACKNNSVCVFDCKNCKIDRFLLRRIEPNQEESMALLNETGTTTTYFAIKFEKHNEIYIVAYQDLMLWKKCANSLPYSFIKENGVLLANWLKLWK